MCSKKHPRQSQNRPKPQSLLLGNARKLSVFSRTAIAATFDNNPPPEA